MKTKLIISILAFLVTTILTNGQNSGAASRPPFGKEQRIALVDANNNSICDCFENRLQYAALCKFSADFDRMVKSQCQGRQQNRCYRCQNHLQVRGRGQYFINDNSSGKCRYLEIHSQK
jgi:hypothetical protein